MTKQEWSKLEKLINEYGTACYKHGEATNALVYDVRNSKKDEIQRQTVKNREDLFGKMSDFIQEQRMLDYERAQKAKTA